MRVDVPEQVEGEAGPLERARPIFARLAKPDAPRESGASAVARVECVQAPASQEVVRRLLIARPRQAVPSKLPPARGHQRKPRLTPGARRVLPGWFSSATVGFPEK